MTMITDFAIGEEINPQTHDLRIKITALEPLRAVVIATYDNRYAREVFPIGKELQFEPSSVLQEHWLLVDRLLPWFVLYVREDGEKRFEHYR